MSMWMVGAWNRDAAIVLLVSCFNSIMSLCLNGWLARPTHSYILHTHSMSSIITWCHQVIIDDMVCARMYVQDVAVGGSERPHSGGGTCVRAVLQPATDTL